MQAIVDKYSTGDSPYLLPIIKNVDTDLRRQYQNASHFVNTKLREIGVIFQAFDAAYGLCCASWLGKYSQK